MKAILLKLPYMYQLLLGFLVAAVVPLLVSTVLILNIVNASLQTQAEKEALHQLTEASKKVDEIAERSVEVSQLICENRIVSRAFINSSNALDSLVYNQIYRPGATLYAGADVAVYDIGGKLRFATNFAVAPAGMPVRWGVLHKANAADELVFYGEQSFDAKPPSYALSTAQNMYYDGAQVGYVVIGFSAANLDNLFGGIISPQSNLIILNDVGVEVYSSAPKMQPKEREMLRARIARLQQGSFDEGGTEYYVQYNEKMQSYIVISQPVVAAGAAMKTLQGVSIVMGFISFALVLMVSVLLSRGISRPIKKLSKAMGQVKKGNLEVQVSTRRNDELGELTRDFNRMTQELALYVDKTVQQQKQMNEAQIRLMQAQLNPHFLYNTLDTIKWTAKMNNIPEIADITSNLANILRQCVSSSQFISLKQELAVVQSYIDIQRIRFSERFEYVVNSPKRLERCEVPKLILQPIVENAILHGLANKESGYIYIYASEIEEGVLQISVTDDGCGMPSKIVQSLSQSSSTIVEGHLGLFNVNNIIKMNYGNQYGISAHAESGVGTTVNVTLPMRWESENV